MPFIERLTNETTPKRVYAYLKLVDEKTMRKEEVVNYLQPKFVDNTSFIANKVYSFVNNAQLISESSDGNIKLDIDRKEIATMKAFRKIIAKRVFQHEDYMFSRFTSWYLMRGEKVFEENAEALEIAFNQELNADRTLPNEYNKTNITGWRTWAAFLGFGYIHNKVLIPNTAVRLHDLLIDANIPKDKSMPLKQFMDWLHLAAPELDGGKINEVNQGDSPYTKQTLSLGLSSGLRALHDQGLLELKYVSDAIDTWYLQKASHDITDKVSEITIRGVEI
ncbi:hypothetical protein J0K78_03325 [Halobacillus sp. GSS1]|uniref:hypothetical protein n=1 Tax=Halobacillus sp. GSS1 TaxID=2815919 RepID=UPI001A8CA5B5|nr:hypothetical protein [Halobacillus sp. GSS1]MBN9653285.1 hypothetical protein [Halobacillus sp. GSS1]